jgi:AraC-like DNA-binding protein
MNLLLSFKVMDVPAQLIKLTYDIPLHYKMYIYNFSRPLLMTTPPVDILYQQKSVDGSMINNTMFFVRQTASVSAVDAVAEVAFYCMLTGSALFNNKQWLYQGQYTFSSDPLLLELEPGVYELHQYGYEKSKLEDLYTVSYPRSISIQLHQAINQVKQTRIHASLADLWMENKLREILILLMDDHIPQQQDQDFTMNTLLDFINNNLETDISIEKLTKIYFISDSTLRRNFIKKFGIPFSQYLQKARLERGEQLLSQTSRHINDIALQVGYKSAAAFTHAFKQHFGYTPRTLRDSNLNGIRQHTWSFESTFIAGRTK